jgi:uncharacterized protein (TIRG00374 family)
MPESSETIAKKLDYRKIIIALVLGLSVAGYLLFSTLNETKYIKVEMGEGEYVLIDSIAETNNKINDNSMGFVGVDNGDYVREIAIDNLKNIHWSWHMGFWLFVALLAMVARDLGYMIRLRTLTDRKFNWRQTFNVVMLWEFASSLSPSIVGGSSIAMFIINREGINMGKSTAIVLITAILDELFYITMVPLVIFFIGSEFLFPVNLEKEFFGITLGTREIFWTGYIFIVVLVLLLGTAIFFKPRLFKYLLLKMFSLKILRKWRRKSLDTGNEIMEASKEYNNKPPLFWISVISSTYFSWMARFLVVNFMIMAFVSNADQILIFGRQIVMWVILLISPTPGGAGVAELAFSGFLGDLIPFGYAAILALLWRLISYYPYLFIGAIILPGWINRTKDNKSFIFNE